MFSILFLIFLFGLCLGSFLNVCIYRLPREQSVIGGRSYCPACDRMIAWHDNIPLLSYVILLGRCRYCDEKISFRYFTVELLSGLALVLAGYYWLFRPQNPYWFNFISYSYLILVSIAILFIDLEFSIIPNQLSYSLIITGLAAGFFTHAPLSPARVSFAPQQFWWSLAGFLVGGTIFLVLALVSPLIYGQSALGMGDVKLIAGYGAWMGPRAALFIIVVGSLIGAVVGSTLMIARGKSLRNEIPFGPFLCLAAVFYLFWGAELVSWYVGLFS